APVERGRRLFHLYGEGAEAALGLHPLVRAVRSLQAGPAGLPGRGRPPRPAPGGAADGRRPPRRSARGPIRWIADRVRSAPARMGAGRAGRAAARPDLRSGRGGLRRPGGPTRGLAPASGAGASFGYLDWSLGGQSDGCVDSMAEVLAELDPRRVISW